MSTVLALAVALGAHAVALLYALVLLACGVLALRGLGLSRGSVPALPVSGHIGLAFALGSGLVGSLWVLLALAHVLLWQVLGLVCAGLLVAAAGPLLALWTEAHAAARRAARELWAGGVVWCALTLLLAVTVLGYGFAALHPAVGDSVALYLPWSRIIAASGQLMHLPGYDKLGDIWILAEIHAAAVMAMAGDWPARPLPWLHTLAAALLFWGLGRSLGVAARGRIVAIAMLFCSSNAGFLLWDGKVDLVALPLGFAALYAALLMRGDLARRFALLAGLLCGAALAAKISYIIPLGAALAVILLWRGWGGHPAGTWRRVLYLCLMCAAGVALMTLPQILKNLALAGEPLAPMFYFGPPRFDAEQAWYSTAVTRRLLLTYPLALVFGDYWAQHGTLTVLLLAFSPLSLFHWGGWPRHGLWLLTLAALAGTAAWMALRPSTFAPRYILCVLALLFLAVADGAARASVAAPRPVRAMVVLALGFELFRTVTGLAQPVAETWHYAAGADIERNADDKTFNMAYYLNAKARPGARIALMGYYRWPLRADLMECAFSQRLTLIFPDHGAALLEQAWLEGSDYLVVDLWTHRRVLADAERPAPPWLRVEAEMRDDRYVVYSLHGGPAAPPPNTSCRLTGRAWFAQPAAESRS